MNITPDTIKWHGETGQRFAFLDHAGQSFTIREDNGYDIYVDMEGDAVHIAWQPVVWAALDYIRMYADTPRVLIVDHKSDLVLVALSTEQAALLRTICDVVRDDDDDTNPCITVADDLYHALEEVKS